MPFYQKIKKYKEKDKRIANINFCQKQMGKRVRLPASAAVEGALVIPLYMYAVLSVIYVLQMLSINSTMMTAMTESVRELSKEAYTMHLAEAVTDNRYVNYAINNTLARQKLINNLPKDFVDNGKIISGSMGISLTGSSFMTDGNKIKLKVTYALKNPFDIFNIGNTKITQQCVGGAWLGEDYCKTAEEQTQDSDKVCYIAKNGTVYHLNSSCTYLKPSVHSVVRGAVEYLRNQSGGKYYSCEYCCDKSVGAVLYITDYGDRYHSDRNCSRIQHEYITKKLSEVENLSPCSKCGR